jgi:teichuronic acid biosynthesis glycosyltransferase TuaG
MSGVQLGDLVSIIMPCYNREKFLLSAIQSVLAQSYLHWELIIIDDASTDNSVAIVQNLIDKRIHLIQHRIHSANPAKLRNLGLKIAKGEWISFLDSDDLWDRDKLSKQIKLNQLWSYCRARYINDEGSPLNEGDVGHYPSMLKWSASTGDISYKLLSTEVSLTTPSVLIKKNLLNKAGVFDEQMKVGEDFELWLRLSLMAEVGCVDETLVSIRKHVKNFSNTQPVDFWLASTYMLEKVLKRYPSKKIRYICYRKLLPLYRTLSTYFYHKINLTKCFKYVFLWIYCFVLKSLITENKA